MELTAEIGHSCANNTSNQKRLKKHKKYDLDYVTNLFEMPFNDLLFKAHNIHRENFDPNQVQISTLLSIKTGACPEDCKYCPQSAHYNTSLKKEPFMETELILKKAVEAKDNGASRFCMGAAWRKLHDKDLEKLCDVVTKVKAMGLETCLTLGMINNEQAKRFKEAGLDYYNHNIDSSEEFYEKIITTRTYQDRLDTLENVANNDINICSGGIVGMGETRIDRAKMLLTLANLPVRPKSVPINMLVKTEGTPLANAPDLDIFEFIKTIAVARILMPESYVRLSAGRSKMSDEAQALSFFAGANSIFYGDKLLTTENPEKDKDNLLFEKLKITKI